MLAPPPEAPFFFWFPSPVDSRQDSLTFSSSPLLIFISNTPSPIISLQICPFFFVLANASSLMERRSQSLLWAFYSFLFFPQATPQSVTKQNFCHDSPWYEPTKKSQLGRSIKSRLCSSEYNLVSSNLFCCRWLCFDSPLARSFQIYPGVPICKCFTSLIYLFLAVLGLCCCVGFSLVVVSGGYSLFVVHGLLIVVASLVAEHGL